MQERRMTENWLPRPFSRAATRQAYRDIDMPCQVPAAYGCKDSYHDMPEEKVDESLRVRMPSPLSPISPISPLCLALLKAPFRDFNRRKSVPKWVDVQSIDNPVGQVTSQRDQTLPAFGSSRSQPQSPYLQPSSAMSPRTSKVSSITLASTPQRHSSRIENRAVTDMEDFNLEHLDNSVIFSRPVSGSSDYQSTMGRYDPEGSFIPASPTYTSTVMDMGRLPSISTTRSLLSLDISDGGSRYGPNLRMLMNGARGD
jgi:hypothetical protein